MLIQDLEATFSFNLSNLENILLEQKAKGKNVRAFILNNPSNPLGMVIDKEIVEQIMRFCQR